MNIIKNLFKKKASTLDSITNALNDNIGFSRGGNFNNSIGFCNTNESCSRAWFNTAIGRKIVDIKTSYSLNGAINFNDDNSDDFYNNNLESAVVNAVELMIAFGRSFLIIEDNNSINSEFIYNSNRAIACNATSDMVGGTKFQESEGTCNLFINDIFVHPSRYIEFRYHRNYDINSNMNINSTYTNSRSVLSEFDLIGENIENDIELQRITRLILRKNSTMFYLIEGLNNSGMVPGRLKSIFDKFAKAESHRSINGAMLLDSKEQPFVANQTLPNLSDADDISLRRLALATRIPFAVLIGQNVTGLNSTGDIETDSFNDMIYQIQHRFLKPPLNKLFNVFNLGDWFFDKKERRTPIEKAQIDNQIFNNALLLQTLGEDYTQYLKDNGFIFSDVE